MSCPSRGRGSTVVACRPPESEGQARPPQSAPRWDACGSCLSTMGWCAHSGRPSLPWASTRDPTLRSVPPASCQRGEACIHDEARGRARKGLVRSGIALPQRAVKARASARPSAAPCSLPAAPRSFPKESGPSLPLPQTSSERTRGARRARRCGLAEASPHDGLARSSPA
eukprot:scaffold1958_cov253-Pinguiococcus_pyrenoidosus.AAC.7